MQQRVESRRRTLRLEKLEDRALLATYTYPYGAQSIDTGEYMLGDVAVNVVLMESDPTLAPYDNNPPDHPTNPGRGAPAENWTSGAIAAVKANVSAGLQWWKDTLYNVFPNAPANLLNFKINWQYADAPVHTGYEPIARTSDEFLVFNGTTPGGWIYDFLSQVGFAESGNFSADLRSFNDYTRQTANTDWAFTIFVVNNAADSDKLFASGGSFSQAFAFAGGRFMVVPASRPAATYAHETGHQFWAIDQYFGGGTYTSRRGYYNTQNLNAADNPAAGFVQADSIMARDEPGRPLYTNAYNSHTSDRYALAQIGWQDSDNDGIFDVLDVPLSLSGSGQFSKTTGVYTFTGSSVVGTLNNANSSGSGNDITINQVNIVEASINNGPWQTVQTFPSRTYQTSLNIALPIGTSPGIYEIRLRSADTRTGVTSNIFFDDIEITSGVGSSVQGIVFRDTNSNGRQNTGEPAFPDVGIEVLDQDDQELNFEREVEPSDFTPGFLLNFVASNEGVTLSATGSGAGSGDVFARSSGFGLVFGTTQVGGASTNLWNDTRKLRVDFNAPVSTVKLRAFTGSTGVSSFARLEAYSADGVLLTRDNSADLRSVSDELTVTRAGGDIKYVIAYGRFGTNVLLDSLTWGPSTSATSGPDGAYSLNGLPDGTYRIHVTAPAGYMVTTPPNGYASVTVSGGISQGIVDFGIGPLRNHPFFNVELAANVDNSPNLIITPNDALMVINYINAGFAAEGEIVNAFTPATIGFIDVDNNGRCTANDALIVINIINAGLGGGEGEQSVGASSSGGTSGSSSGSSASDSGPEGETTVIVPRSPAEYFAQNPQRVMSLRGDDQPCTCQSCVGARTDVALEALQTSGAVSRQPEPSPLGLLLASGKEKSRGIARQPDAAIVLNATLGEFKRPGRGPVIAAKHAVADEETSRRVGDEGIDNAIDALLASTEPDVS
jgi:hypothetical protein